MSMLHIVEETSICPCTSLYSLPHLSPSLSPSLPPSLLYPFLPPSPLPPSSLSLLSFLPPFLPSSLSPSSLSLPLDINECSINSDNCDQLCTNTEGGFNCSCNDGFLLQSDMRSCIGEHIREITKAACTIVEHMHL